MTSFSWPFAVLLAVSLIATGGMVWAHSKWGFWKGKAWEVLSIAQKWKSRAVVAEESLARIHAQRSAAAKRGHIAQSAIAAARRAGKNA